MKVNIWIKKEEVLTGNITEYLTSITNGQGTEDYVQVSITQDEFAVLEDNNKEKYTKEFDQSVGDSEDWSSDHWIVKQYNRNRNHAEQVKSKDEIPYIYERNSDNGDVSRRKSGDYDGKREYVKVGLGERVYSNEKDLNQLTEEMTEKTGADFMTWFHKLTKTEQTKLAASYND